MTDFDDVEMSLDNFNPYEILNKFIDENNIEFFTDLNDREIRSIAVILFLSDYLKMPEFLRFITMVMKLKVSRNRKGRGEFINLFQGFKETMDKKEELNAKKGIP